MEIACFFAGMAFFYFKSLLPLVFVVCILFFRPCFKYIGFFMIAIVWCMVHEWFNRDQGMPSQPLIRGAYLQGYVVSIPLQSWKKNQFQFRVESLNGKPTYSNIMLSCYAQCMALHAGDYLALRAHLKHPRNLENPASFDYVSLLHTRHIHWVGNVLAHTMQPLKNAKHHFFLLKLREHLSKTLQAIYPTKTQFGIFEALTLGLTHHIDKAQWDLFRRTGTTHLIDISGEHIALVAGVTYALTQWFWKRCAYFCLLCPVQKIASLVALFVSFSYAEIAGFSAPTQRALVMCILMFVHYFASQKLTIWQAWRYALLFVLVLEPHSVHMLGFYFSFLAVAILIVVNQRWAVRRVPKLLLLQLACLIGLMPLVLYWFAFASLDGFLANIVAIPWVGFCIVPLALIITLFCPWGVIPGSVQVLDWLMRWFMRWLLWVDSLNFFNIEFTFISSFTPLVIMLGMIIWVMCPQRRTLPAASFLIITSFFPHYEKTPWGRARLDVMDVGQGLAVVIRTQHHVAIYDTGVKFYSGSDMGALVLVPYLNKLGINHLDKVIISHKDLDHRGGLATLQSKYLIDELIVEDPISYGQGNSCHEHASWVWDGVQFQFFPIQSSLRGRNNHSCVLKVSNASGSMLLSGDIERGAERYLVKTYGKELQSSILLVPHHASKTSSSELFLNVVAPQYAIASYSWDNRYHFPHELIVKRYQEHGIPMQSTANCGMMSVHLKSPVVVDCRITGKNIHLSEQNHYG